MSWLFDNMRYKVLALLVAFMLWGVAHSTGSIEQGFDVPITIHGVPENLVVTTRSSDAVNIRVKGSRAALRSLSVGSLEYEVDLAGAKRGRTEFEVDVSQLLALLPRGADIVSRSPLELDFTLERRGTKSVKVRPDLEGDPSEGYVVAGIQLEPSRVRITGARSEVLRLSEVLTETIDVTGAAAPIERKVRTSIRGQNVWIEEEQEITVRVQVELEEPPVEAIEETG